jgi:molybdenum cofactor biosynthesis protein B
MNASTPSDHESSHLDHQQAASNIPAIGFAIITLSDTRTEATDKSGAFLKQSIEDNGHRVARYEIVSDDPEAIAQALDAALSDPDVGVLVTTGGTGISARDSAYETISSRLDKRLDGFGELFRMLSFKEIGAAAMLSRAVGGVASGRALFALPGSTAAVRLGFEQLILPQVQHLHHELTRHAN